MKLKGNTKNKVKNKNPIFFIFFFILSALFISVFLLFGDFFINKSYDIYVKYIGSNVSKPSDDIVLLLIDENSMKYGENIGLGNWPWKRTAYPVIIDFINKISPPKAVFFDILFSESSQFRETDEYFAESIAFYKNIYQNMQLVFNDERKNPIELPEDIKQNFALSLKNPENIKFKIDPNNEYYTPIPCLRSDMPCSVTDLYAVKAKPRSAGISVASVNPDPDGVYRRAKLLFRYGESFFPSFSVAAVMAYSRIKTIEILKGNIIKIGDYDIPVDKNGNYLVNYHKNKNRIPAYSVSGLLVSAEMLLNGETDNLVLHPEIFRDKIVIIGVSAVGGQDLKNTPLSRTTPGPEIHATIISNILQNNYIKTENTVITIIIVLAITGSCIFTVLRMNNPRIKLLLIIAIFLIIIVYSISGFRLFNYMSPFIFTLVSAVFSSGISFAYLSITEGAEKRKYSKILGNMIDPHIVNEALKDLESLKKGGEKTITAFFSDIASFSTISEMLSSEQLAALLNEYLSEMTIILKKHGGTLDKYIGDAIVGIFGAPVDEPDNALLAARASLEMRDKLAELRIKWTNENAYCTYAQKMQFRIGLNTGKAKVGFMGTEKLASYTMMGDTVNLASRLEAAAKDYGVTILVSKFTKDYFKEDILVRELDLVRVKGKEEPVSIYEVINYKNKTPENIIEAVKLYEKAFQLYRNREFREAIKYFEKSQETRGETDKSAGLLIDRCGIYAENPPAAFWDGVFTRTHK